MLSTGVFTQAVDRVKALIACYVFSVAGRPIAGHSAARVKEAQVNYTAAVGNRSCTAQ
jgi:hypothetical protein